MRSKSSGNSFCVTGVPSLVELVGIGEYSSDEWGLKGFKLPLDDVLLKLSDRHVVYFSFGVGNEKIRTIIRPSFNYADEEVCCHFENLRPTQYLRILGMVISATTLKFTN